MWFWLSLSKFFNKIGNYFYHLHVKVLKVRQRRSYEKRFIRKHSRKKEENRCWF